MTSRFIIAFGLILALVAGAVAVSLVLPLAVTGSAQGGSAGEFFSVAPTLFVIVGLMVAGLGVGAVLFAVARGATG